MAAQIHTFDGETTEQLLRAAEIYRLFAEDAERDGLPKTADEARAKAEAYRAEAARRAMLAALDAEEALDSLGYSAEAARAIGEDALDRFRHEGPDALSRVVREMRRAAIALARGEG